MLLLKSSFSYLFIALIAMMISFNSLATFSDVDCIQSNFDTKIVHKGPPVGMINVILEIQKKGCVISVEHNKLKFVSKKWVIDVCRSPVHIKYGTGAVDVLKRKGRCNPGELNDFCPAYETLSYVLQDDGLIFAEGEREDLNQPHGQVFCSYLLVKSYLGKGMVFSKDSKYDSILDRNEPIDGSMFVKPSNDQPTIPNEIPEEKKAEQSW